MLESRDSAEPGQSYGTTTVGNPGNPSLVVKNVPAGSYWLRVYPSGPYYAQSAKSGTADLQRQQLVIGGGESVPTIEVVLRDDPGAINGSVAMSGDNAAWILSIPDGNVERAQEWPVDSSGRFGIPGLAPGRYRVLAMDRDDWEYGDMQTLEKYLLGAKEVAIEANQTATVELELTRIGASPQ